MNKSEEKQIVRKYFQSKAVVALSDEDVLCHFKGDCAHLGNKVLRQWEMTQNSES